MCRSLSCCQLLIDFDQTLHPASAGFFLFFFHPAGEYLLYFLMLYPNSTDLSLKGTKRGKKCQIRKQKSFLVILEITSVVPGGINRQIFLV